MKRFMLMLALFASPAAASPCLWMLDPGDALACLAAERGAPVVQPRRSVPQPGFAPDTRFMGDRLMQRAINGNQWVCTYTRGQVVVLPTYQQCPTELPY